jgi:hypothetical protein
MSTQRASKIAEQIDADIRIFGKCWMLRQRIAAFQNGK